MINLGIIGMGYMGRTHLAASSQVPDAQLAAVASRQFENLEHLQPDVRVYTSYDALLQDDGLDAVIICLPTFLHEHYVLRAVEAGRHVLCEKPFALDVAAAGRMLEAANRQQVTLMIGQVLRFWPHYVRIKNELDAGTIGSIRTVSAYRLAQYPDWGQWFQDPEKSGGCLLDLQIHDVDFIHWILGHPQQVFTTGLRSAAGSWDNVYTTLSYPNAVASVEASYTMPESWPFRTSIRINGTRGCLEYTFQVAGNVGEVSHAQNRLVLYGSNDVVELDVAADNSFAPQLQYFISCIMEHKSPVTNPPEESLQVMEVMAALKQSADTRQVIALTDT
jgi:UDP-N-acetylglucosamine 3-dehydrogenase